MKRTVIDCDRCGKKNLTESYFIKLPVADNKDYQLHTNEDKYQREVKDLCLCCVGYLLDVNWVQHLPVGVGKQFATTWTVGKG